MLSIPSRKRAPRLRWRIRDTPDSSKKRLPLSEDAKKQVFKEVVAIERNADRKAEKMYPDNASPDIREQIKKQRTYADRVIKKQKSALARKYGLTLDELDKITVEGVQKGWLR